MTMAKIMSSILSKHTVSSWSPSHSFCGCTSFDEGHLICPMNRTGAIAPKSLESTSTRLPNS